MLQASNARSNDAGTAAPNSDKPVAPRSEQGGNLRVEGARTVLQGLVAAARDNARRPAGGKTADATQRRLAGDELTEHLIRQAARVADSKDVVGEVATWAFLVALGIGLDHSTLLRDNPLVRGLCRAVESDTERKERLAVLGQPTLFGRHDLAQHFVVSGFLTAVSGKDAAEGAGVAKELIDARSGSGFSFADLAADYAGITFATQLLTMPASLRDVGSKFSTTDYLPTLADLPEGLDAVTFADRFGSPTDDRFREMQKLIRSRIDQLPAYRGNDGK